MRTLFVAAPFSRGLGETREEITRLVSLRARLQGERSADAQDFAAMTQAGRRRYELLEEIRKAEALVRSEERRWEETHRNFQDLEAARSSLGTLTAEHDNVKAQVETLRRRVDDHAEAIGRLWGQIQALIDSMPPELQAEAKDMMAVCMTNLSGCSLHGSIGCKKCQKGKKRKPPYDPFKPQMLGMLQLAQAPAPGGKADPTTAVPGSKPEAAGAQVKRIDDLFARLAKIHAYVAEHAEEAQKSGLAELAQGLPSGSVLDYPKLAQIYQDLQSGKTVPASSMKCVDALEDGVKAAEAKMGGLGKATPWVVGGSALAIVAGVGYAIWGKK